MHLTPFRCVTLTGVDTKTDLVRVAELGKLYPYAEWGVLYSPAHVGKSNRHGDLDFCYAVGRFFEQVRIPSAVHLCGRAVRDLVQRDPLVETLTAPFGRVQLNLIAKRYTAEELIALGRRVLERAPNQRLILQYNSANADLCRQLAGHEPFEFLFDSSGGRGRLPKAWPASSSMGLGASKLGYSGGLGPDTLPVQKDAILAAAEGRQVWVDMEGQIRDEADWFDLNKARAALNAVQPTA